MPRKTPPVVLPAALPLARHPVLPATTHPDRASPDETAYPHSAHSRSTYPPQSPLHPPMMLPRPITFLSPCTTHARKQQKNNQATTKRQTHVDREARVTCFAPLSRP